MARRRLPRNERRRQLAVALRFDEERDVSPRVIARGAGLVAEKIVETARQHNIPIRDDPDLTEALSQLDLGQVIPPELYPAVAEVLAYIYRINGKVPA